MVRAADAAAVLAGQRRVRQLAEEDAARDAVLAQALVAELEQGGDAVERVFERSQGDADVDDRLGGEAGDRRAADVLDGHGPLADRRLQARALGLEQRGQAGS